ncbi:ABC-three component system protein [Pseudoalteromonas sp. SR43-2]|uniref:ABC-three component system protein n=2 Tax=Pseudoalteromonas TaxID=53246 RepID=UPI0015F9C9DA|nr:ABC-three component system protein [Pseudoalteromonas sp. SR43-2]MBB1378980.1 hypothetical protein [Pseudoalteromonas sp. SR43-2]
MQPHEFSFPHTANPTWSGFIYQGHVALYHSICCLINELEFELQLDSLEDFSIYQNGKAGSTHQVKALDKDKRNDYLPALSKAAATHIDCDEHTKRYFHVTSKLDDSSDFQEDDGNVVEFYSYEGKDQNLAYCYLQDIEKKVKEKISDYLSLRNLAATEFLIDFKFNLLHSKIASQVVYIHACNQDLSILAAEVAYKERIYSKELQSLLHEEVAHSEDIDYQRAIAKKALYFHFYDYINSTSFKGVDKDIKLKLVKVLKQIKTLDNLDFSQLWKSLCLGSSEKSINNERVYDYVDIIAEIKKYPVLANVIPYYKCQKMDKYLPTSIRANKRVREIKFSEDLVSQLKEDENLIDILVEYEWLIADCDNQFSPVERFCSAGGIERESLEEQFLSTRNDRNNVTKAFEARVISCQVAGERLDD